MYYTFLKLKSQVGMKKNMKLYLLLDILSFTKTKESIYIVVNLSLP